MRSSRLLAAAFLPATALAGCTVGPTKCYVDSSSRLLGDGTNVADGFSAIDKAFCAELCRERNMTLAGAENGNECYCGDKLNGASPTTSTRCTTACAGGTHRGETCGGYWALEVFDVNCSGAPEPTPKQASELVNPCVDPSTPQSKQPWCDPTLSLEDRVDDAVSRLTLAEKISAMATSTDALPSLGLPAYK